MKPLESYVVCIYRRDREAFAGLVEHVPSERTAPFASATELCELLCRRRPWQRFRRPVRNGDPE